MAKIKQDNIRIKASINEYKSATTEQKGIIRIATQEEVNIGMDNSIAVTPYTLNNIIGNIESALNTINSGSGT